MNPICLSPSSLSLYKECPHCFWMDKVKGKKRPGGIFPSLPNGMDRILKEHFDKHRKDGSLPEELEGHVHGRLYPDQAKLDAFRARYKGLKYTDKETSFSLNGLLDDLFVTSEGHYAPLDFKTKGSPKNESSHTYYQHQMDIYSFLLEKQGLTPASYAILIFYSPVKVNETTHHMEFKPEPMKVEVDRTRGERLFKDAVKCICGPEPKAENDCEWCGWGSTNHNEK